MSDPIKETFGPIATALVEAVATHDPDQVAALLEPLDRHGLEAIAVVLADRVPPRLTDPEKLGVVITEAARAFGTTASAITGTSRFREDVDARGVVCYAGRLLGLSYSEIGRQIGRDHSTVMHAYSRIGTVPGLRKCAERIAGGLGWSREDMSA